VRCRFALFAALVFAGLAGCGPARPAAIARMPRVAPTTQPADVAPLKLEASKIQPLYREVLAVDINTVLRTAAADNLDIQTARQRVEQFRGEFESAVGGVFPAVVPTAVFDHFEGTIRAVQGNPLGAGFNSFSPSIAVQWVLNPGKVVYELVAARKRLGAARHEEQQAVQDALRQAAVQYYDLVLAQHGVSTAYQAVREAAELLRINRLRERTGTGVPADVLRAEAREAQTQQELVSAIDTFYRESVALSVTLHLDASVTLIPRIYQLPPVTLVDPELSLDELVELAVASRPDLKTVGMLVQAAAAAKGATWWGAFGPQFQVSYQYGGIIGHANNTIPAQGIPNNLILNPLSPTGVFTTNPFVNSVIREGISRGSTASAHRGDESYSLHRQQSMRATAGWHFSFSAIGDLRAAGAIQTEAAIEAERTLDQVKAQVVIARQACRTEHELMVLSQRQTAAADETLRLSQANLQAGTMTTLDVLQAEEAADQARLQRAQAVVRYNQAQINLLAALGLLDVRAVSNE